MFSSSETCFDCSIFPYFQIISLVIMLLISVTIAEDGHDDHKCGGHDHGDHEHGPGHVHGDSHEQGDGHAHGPDR